MKAKLKQKFTFLLVVLMVFINSALNAQNSWKLISPDKRINIQVTNDAEISYTICRFEKNKKIIVLEKSPLGIIREDEQFAENLSFVSQSKVKTIDEKYEMKIGRQLTIQNKTNELELTFKNLNGSLIKLVLRAYNDGVAFKYVFPEKTGKTYTITQELTGFKLPVDGKCWIQPYDKPSRHSPGYELNYANKIAIGTSSPTIEGWAFPALFNSNGNWILISEANLMPNYCGIRLEQKAENGLYKVRFPDTKDGEGFGAVNPSSVVPWEMPWRTIAIGNSLSAIYESQLINNVCDKQIEGDFSWVKPGRSSWSWISNPPSSKNYDALKEFVDLAAEMKWEYSLVDANWNIMSGGNIEQLVQYANSKNVGILMWYNSGGPNNIVTEEPRDIINNPEKRKAEFQKLQKWGVKGVKIDFWQSDKQNMIQLYHDVLVDAAKYHILVNFHGCTIPRGWSRTYPNLVSFESVKGEECYLFDKNYPETTPIQNSILPFTRNVVGPMDYTPFSVSNLRYPHQTSFAHELALTLVFHSGILHFAESVEGMRKLPQFVKEFLYQVPVAFDESHLVSGYPGKDVVIASRKGKNWYIAGINSEKASKDLNLELPFLKNGNYNLKIINDGVDNKSFVQNVSKLKKGNHFQITMNNLGGFVAVLSPE